MFTCVFLLPRDQVKMKEVFIKIDKLCSQGNRFLLDVIQIITKYNIFCYFMYFKISNEMEFTSMMCGEGLNTTYVMNQYRYYL